MGRDRWLARCHTMSSLIQRNPHLVSITGTTNQAPYHSLKLLQPRWLKISSRTTWSSNDLQQLDKMTRCHHSNLVYATMVTYPISVAHCSRSQDIDLFKFQLSYCNSPLQDTCPITSAVLRHIIRTQVPLIFLNRDKKFYRLSEKCATLPIKTGSWRFFVTMHEGVCETEVQSRSR